ncbi:phosphopentomutase-like [Drosophila albomicans]|uniref:Phosphopentomutase-like n=1 Tax=Drosophila albomicans TaxID=7291 RepID=A0A6P8XC68_DROAB|nr:phosphopentomutase-like [Drosophila albomicans]
MLATQKLFVTVKLSSNWRGLLRNAGAFPNTVLQTHIVGQHPRIAVLPHCQSKQTWSHQFPILKAPRATANLHCLSGDRELDKKINNWLEWDRNPETWCTIKDAIKAQEWDKLRSWLMGRLKFGTAGLRAEMRPGFNAMNDLVVIQTAQGLCAYLKEQFPDKKKWCKQGIVIGYDSRHNSKRFAELTAVVFLTNEFRVNLFQRFVATPFVPYTILRYNCLAGVMVTASHNPKQDNGYKVYWSNGTQIITPHDDAIYQCILKNLQPTKCSWDRNILIDNELLYDPYDSIIPAYYDALRREIPSQLLVANADCPLSFTYTAMHGVGYAYVEMAFPTCNLDEVIPVEEQVEPDPDFPTAPHPNPEEGEKVMKLSIETATSNDSQIILANDPDADRLAVGEIIDDGEYKLFTGNELAALLGWWALEIYKMGTEKADLAKCTMISSTVSSMILKSMAAVEGFNFHETLTGFKWIGNKVIDEQKAGKKVLFAFEEAIGYMVTTNVIDKDGISAAAHVATMACYLRTQKCMSLQDKLRDIYEKYGFHTSVVNYVICSDVSLIKTIFKRLRTFKNNEKNTYPTSLLDGEFEIEHVRDLTTGYDSSKPDKKATLPVNSSTQMITFTFKNGFVITLRTSGTEPKMKYYAEMCGKPEDKRWDELELITRRMVKAAVDEFYEPEKNGLQRNS